MIRIPSDQFRASAPLLMFACSVALLSARVRRLLHHMVARTRPLTTDISVDSSTGCIVTARDVSRGVRWESIRSEQRDQSTSCELSFISRLDAPVRVCLIDTDGRLKQLAVMTASDAAVLECTQTYFSYACIRAVCALPPTLEGVSPHNIVCLYTPLGGGLRHAITLTNCPLDSDPVVSVSFTPVATSVVECSDSHGSDSSAVQVVSEWEREEQECTEVCGFRVYYRPSTQMRTMTAVGKSLQQATNVLPTSILVALRNNLVVRVDGDPHPGYLVSGNFFLNPLHLLHGHSCVTVDVHGTGGLSILVVLMMMYLDIYHKGNEGVTPWWELLAACGEERESDDAVEKAAKICVMCLEGGGDPTIRSTVSRVLDCGVSVSTALSSQRLGKECPADKSSGMEKVTTNCETKPCPNSPNRSTESVTVQTPKPSSLLDHVLWAVVYTCSDSR